jgi:hypothetical protein
MGSELNGKVVKLSGITISYVNQNGLIYEKWVERNAFEVLNELKS